MSGLAQSDQVVSAKECIWSGIESEIVILNLASGRYYSLNQTGAALWRFVQQPRTFADICTHVVDSFEVSPEECARDAAEIISQLRDAGLVSVTSSPENR